MKVSLLSALAAVLMHLSFPLVPSHPYLRYDPSEVPALIAGFALGPLAGMAVVLLKNLLYLMSHLQPGELIGIPLNTLAGWTMVGVSASCYRIRKRKSIAIFSLALGVIAMTLIMIPANLVLLPIFQRFFGQGAVQVAPEQVLNLLLLFVTPFNLAKGAITSLLTFLIYKRVSPTLKVVPSWDLEARVAR